METHGSIRSVSLRLLLPGLSASEGDAAKGDPDKVNIRPEARRRAGERVGVVSSLSLFFLSRPAPEVKGPTLTSHPSILSPLLCKMAPWSKRRLSNRCFVCLLKHGAEEMPTSCDKSHTTTIDRIHLESVRPSLPPADSLLRSFYLIQRRAAPLCQALHIAVNTSQLCPRTSLLAPVCHFLSTLSGLRDGVG